MSDLLEKYRRKAHELHEQGKTGYECTWCGQTKKTRNNYGVFCAGCGYECKTVILTAFGVPVYDAIDAFELQKSAGFLHPMNWIPVNA